MQEAEGLRQQEASLILSERRRVPLGKALARASSWLRVSTALERALRWSWAGAAAWAALALLAHPFAPWALLGCAISFALSCVFLFILGRADRFQAARAVDRASGLNELVSTAIECDEGRIESSFCPLVVAEAERACARGLWRLPRPGLPSGARYAAVPAALLVLFALLPGRVGGRGKDGDEPTAEEILGGSGEGEMLSRAGKRRISVAARARAGRRAVARRKQAPRKAAGVKRASRSDDGKGAAGAEKRAGKPARAFGGTTAPERRGPLAGGGAWTEQEEAELAVMVETHPRYAGVIGRYFHGGE